MENVQQFVITFYYDIKETPKKTVKYSQKFA